VRSLAISAVLAVGAHAPSAAQALRFSAGDLANWPERSFSGETDYRLVRKDGVSVPTSGHCSARRRTQLTASR
jgi:hypothetical protein